MLAHCVCSLDWEGREGSVSLSQVCNTFFVVDVFADITILYHAIPSKPPRRTLPRTMLRPVGLLSLPAGMEVREGECIVSDAWLLLFAGSACV